MESAGAALYQLQAGAHPDLTFSFAVKQDPASKPNPFGLHDAYASTRNVRFDLPPGLIGNPNVLGVPQQCTAQELITYNSGGGCPNGSQIGRVTLSAYGLASRFTEPVYMMEPPGGDLVARVGFIAGVFATFVDFRVRTEGDFGLVAEVTEAPTAAARWPPTPPSGACRPPPPMTANAAPPAKPIRRVASSPKKTRRARGRCPSSPTRPAAACRCR